jgi:GDP-4-dehydro-6-deoxy-D-mannose reductase
VTPARILLTGAQGFVGGHLVPALQAAFPSAELLTQAFDVCDRTAVHLAIASARPCICIHLAAISSVPRARRDPGLAWAVNLHGTLNLAEALLADAPDCWLIFVSSADAYGLSFQAGHPLDEQALLAPANTYGVTKASADLALGAMASDGLRVIRLRPFNHVGPGQSDIFALPAFARQIVQIRAGLQAPVLTVGNLGAWRDFLDVRDVCAAYVAVLTRIDELESGLIINIASGESRRIGDILEQMLDLAGIRPEVRVAAERLRPSDTPFAVGDPSRARALLGWMHRIAWSRTLSDLLDDAHARFVIGTA